MTPRGKFILTILILAVAGFGIYRWWDRLAPAPPSSSISVNPDEIKKALAAKGNDDAAVASKLLIGDKSVSLFQTSPHLGSLRQLGAGAPRLPYGQADVPGVTGSPHFSRTDFRFPFSAHAGMLRHGSALVFRRT